MDKIDQYLGQQTLIVGDVNSGKTAQTLKILNIFLKAGYAENIAILDLAPDMMRGIGGKMVLPQDEPVLYLTTSISAPRLTGDDENHIRRLAENNAKEIEKLFAKYRREKRSILFVNDATLYLQTGHFDRFMEIINIASTQVINAYCGNTFADSQLTQREKKLTENLMKTCNRIITMPEGRLQLQNT